METTHLKATSLRTHTCGDLRDDNNNDRVTLCGWVHNRRDHGGLIFIDLRDKYGLTQIVFDPDVAPKEVFEVAESIRSEWVLQVTGEVRMRSAPNPKIPTGLVEVFIDELIVHNKSKTPPFPIDEYAEDASEELRLEYRYLDLRREKMRKNLEMRAKTQSKARQFFEGRGFMDIETPMLVKGTPEGSREYLVPSRLYPGEFYVLPQAPQQMKQLLMLAGYDKYYQFAHCFRDEDMRGDRQPEFTQLDFEMSFVGMEDILETLESLHKFLSKEVVPEKTLMHDIFPRMTYHEVMNLYGTDKPDIRFDLKLQDATEYFQGSGINFMEDAIAKGAIVKALVIPEAAEFTRKQFDDLTEMAKTAGAGGMAYLTYGEEVKGSIIKLLPEGLAEKMREGLSIPNGAAVVFVAEEWEKACTVTGVLRSHLGKEMKLANPNELAFLFVTDFPCFEKKEDGSIQAVHHPFTMPWVEHMHLLEKEETKLDALSQTYDLVLNGYELGSGSVRIHEQELQKKIFEYMNIGEEDQERLFGHLLKAFQYGVPPHAGFAVGIERLVMIFADMENIREVIAFPKTSKARDLMFGAPSLMPENKLDEANIKALT